MNASTVYLALATFSSVAVLVVGAAFATYRRPSPLTRAALQLVCFLATAEIALVWAGGLAPTSTLALTTFLLGVAQPAQPAASASSRQLTVEASRSRAS